MTRYFIIIMLVLFAALCGATAGLYGVNARLKAEIKTLEAGLRTCMEAGQALEKNRAALLKQLSGQEIACQEQIKRTRDAYNSLLLKNSSKKQSVGSGEKPRFFGANPSKEGGVGRGNLWFPPQTTTTSCIPPIEKSTEGAAVVKAAAPEVLHTQQEVITREENISVIAVFNDAFGVFRESGNL